MSSTAITISKQSQASNPTREHKALAAARRKGPGVVRQRAGEPPKCAACGSIPPLPSTASSQGGWPHRPRYLWGSRCACPLQTCPWSPGCWSCGGQGRAARRKPAAVSSAGAAAFLRASLCSHSHAQDVRNGGWRGGGTREGTMAVAGLGSRNHALRALAGTPRPALGKQPLFVAPPSTSLLEASVAQGGQQAARGAPDPTTGPGRRFHRTICTQSGSSWREPGEGLPATHQQEGEAGTDLETCASPPTHLPQGTGRGIRPRTGCFKADKRDG